MSLANIHYKQITDHLACLVVFVESREMISEGKVDAMHVSHMFHFKVRFVQLN